jgi:chloramphenicol O-acetyltransferase type A
MKQKLDLENWARKEQYYFFKQFEEPFWGVCVPIDCTKAYQLAKERGHSFSLYYLYQALAAANEIECFRYRILENEAYIFDAVDASVVILRENGSFGFSFTPFSHDFSAFLQGAQAEVTRVQGSTNLMPPVISDCVIHFSTLPWLDFTSNSHARSFSYKDTSPKISFGKMTTKGKKKTMPVSIHVHHALMDGLHVGQFVERFQELMNQ